MSLLDVVARRNLRTSDGSVRVFGGDREMPSGWQRWYHREDSLAEVLANGDEEHHSGCHGPDCDERCAEVTYAIWSAAGWS